MHASKFVFAHWLPPSPTTELSNATRTKRFPTAAIHYIVSRHIKTSNSCPCLHYRVVLRILLRAITGGCPRKLRFLYMFSAPCVSPGAPLFTGGAGRGRRAHWNPHAPRTPDLYAARPVNPGVHGRRASMRYDARAAGRCQALRLVRRQPRVAAHIGVIELHAARARKQTQAVVSAHDARGLAWQRRTGKPALRRRLLRRASRFSPRNTAERLVVLPVGRLAYTAAVACRLTAGGKGMGKRNSRKSYNQGALYVG